MKISPKWYVRAAALLILAGIIVFALSTQKGTKVVDQKMLVMKLENQVSETDLSAGAEAFARYKADGIIIHEEEDSHELLLKPEVWKKMTAQEKFDFVKNCSFYYKKTFYTGQVRVRIEGRDDIAAECYGKEYNIYY